MLLVVEVGDEDDFVSLLYMPESNRSSRLAAACTGGRGAETSSFSFAIFNLSIVLVVRV